MTDQTYSFRVGGMSCAGCARRVEKAAAADTGATFAAVNLAAGTLTVGGAAPATVRDALARAGYPAETEEIALDVHQMTCASCVARVEKALMAVPGVIEARANLAGETARVTLMAGSAAPADLAAAVRAIGYEATPQRRRGAGAGRPQET
jgi:P-type Cu+ transporter